jgi:hypothetical protein
MRKLRYCAIALLIGLCPAGKWARAIAQSSHVKSLSPEELQALEKKGKIYFLDVREPKEIEELGSMKGYVNIPLSQLERRLSEVPKNALIVTA